jgi:integrase
VHKVKLTDRKLLSLKPIHPETKKPLKVGERYELMDTIVPKFGVRVTAQGRRTFILVARYPGSSNPTRRAIGEYDAVSLNTARTTARNWLELIQKGIDPHLELERQRRSEQRKRENTFAAVAEAFIAEKLSRERKGREVERDIRRQLIPLWGRLPITEITDIDVIAMVKAKGRTAPAQARNLLGVVKRLLRWAYVQKVYGLTVSPADGIKPVDFLEDKAVGDRILSDDELFALWRASGCLPYPHGPIYRLLMLSALRLNEAADASWSEFDLTKRIWTIPAARMKGKNRGKGQARPHAVPLTGDILFVLDTLPRFTKGDHLFSTTFGASPAWMTDKVKKRVDKRMLRTLRALARRRGGDLANVTLPHWTNHDIRRTVRSGLSRLKVTEEAREAVLAHVRPGIKGTYDHHDYLEEKREALTLWAARLRTIVEPAPANVVVLPTAARVGQ